MAEQEQGWTEVGRSGARQEPELNERRPPSEESEQNPFGQLGETDDPSTDLAATTQDAAESATDGLEDAAGNAKDSAEELKEGTEDAAGTATEGAEEAAQNTGKETEQLREGAKDIAGQAMDTTEDWAGQAKDSAKDTANKAGEEVSNWGNAADRTKESGFGTAGKDAEIKAPIGGNDGSLPEYGSADDEFVTRTNYPPSEPEGKSFVEAAKSFFAGAASTEETGPGTLVSLKNSIAGMDD